MKHHKDYNYNQTTYPSNNEDSDSEAYVDTIQYEDDDSWDLDYLEEEHDYEDDYDEYEEDVDVMDSQVPQLGGYNDHGLPMRWFNPSSSSSSLSPISGNSPSLMSGGSDHSLPMRWYNPSSSPIMSPISGNNVLSGGSLLAPEEESLEDDITLMMYDDQMPM